MFRSFFQKNWREIGIFRSFKILKNLKKMKKKKIFSNIRIYFNTDQKFGFLKILNSVWIKLKILFRLKKKKMKISQNFQKFLKI